MVIVHHIPEEESSHSLPWFPPRPAPAPPSLKDSLPAGSLGSKWGQRMVAHVCEEDYLMILPHLAEVQGGAPASLPKEGLADLSEPEQVLVKILPRGKFYL